MRPVIRKAPVLGKVTPDRFVLDKHSLTFKERVLSGKDGASLTDDQIGVLAELGMRVEAYFKTPCDIEWALLRGEFFLLQSRSIKGIRSRPMTLIRSRSTCRRESESGCWRASGTTRHCRASEASG